jgi:hypothetical protein
MNLHDRIFKNLGFGKSDTSKVRIINPVNSPEKVNNQSQIRYKIRCTNCQQVNTLKVKPEKNYILTCPKCFDRFIVTKVTQSAINPFDYTVNCKRLKHWEYRI